MRVKSLGNPIEKWVISDVFILYITNEGVQTGTVTLFIDFILYGDPQATDVFYLSCVSSDPHLHFEL